MDDADDAIQGAPRPGGREGQGQRLGLVRGTMTGWHRDRRIGWASEARASSRFRGHPARAALGPPQVYPRLEDEKASWAPLRPDGGVEWLDLTFEPSPDGEGDEVDRIYVFETCGPGAVFAATDVVESEDYRLQGKRWRVIWQDLPQRLDAREASLLVIDVAPARPLSRLRLWLNTRIDGTWNMVDAVGLRHRAPRQRLPVLWMPLSAVVRAKLERFG